VRKAAIELTVDRHRWHSHGVCQWNKNRTAKFHRFTNVMRFSTDCDHRSSKLDFALNNGKWSAVIWIELVWTAHTYKVPPDLACTVTDKWRNR